MRRVTAHEVEIELLWRQIGPDEWIALLTDPQTGQRVEAHSEAELQQALKSLGDGGGKRPARRPQTR